MVKGDYDKRRRAELASFLRTRRQRLTPAEVGLPPGSRRRTPGLRREELAQLAGVGVTWYTWLEQGRPINPSTQVLDAVARVLALGEAERWHLYRLAEVPGIPAPAQHTPLPEDTVAVLDALEPNPAAIYSGKYDLLASNESYAAMFPWLVIATGHERNAIWQLYTNEGRPLCDPKIMPHMVAVARANYARHVGEPEWDEWIDRMCAASAAFAELWATHEVAHSIPSVKDFTCFDVGTVSTRTTSFAVVGAPETRMVVYLPASAADAAKIETLRVRARRRLRPA